MAYHFARKELQKYLCTISLTVALREMRIIFFLPVHTYITLHVFF